MVCKWTHALACRNCKCIVIAGLQLHCSLYSYKEILKCKKSGNTSKCRLLSFRHQNVSNDVCHSLVDDIKSGYVSPYTCTCIVILPVAIVYSRCDLLKEQPSFLFTALSMFNYMYNTIYESSDWCIINV